MPKKERFIAAPGLSKDSILSLCYSCFKQLNWGLSYADDTRLIATIPGKWNAHGQELTVIAEDNAFTISSATIGGQLFDLAGKNNQNINAFLAVLETANKGGLSVRPDADDSLETLRQTTNTQIEEEMAEAAELKKLMYAPGGNLYATYGIMALNTIIFILMVVDGAGIGGANGWVHLKWGSNFSTLTLSGDWWRLITSAFIHFGFIHLAVNMYSFYFAGKYLEPMLGKARFIAAYLCTGMLAGLTSLWWHHEPVNSAGASGAIFGMYGVFLAFLSSHLIPSKMRQALLQSILIFVVYNLAFGMKGGIDNAAHVGGLCSGFVIGYIYIAVISREKINGKNSIKWAVPFVALITVLSAGWYLQQNRATAEERNEILAQLENASYKDSNKFSVAYSQFIALQDAALQVWKDSTVSESVLNARLKQTSLPAWDKAAELVQKMQSFEVNKRAHGYADTLLQYVNLRKQEIDIFDDYVANKTNVYRLKIVRLKIDTLVQALQR